MKCLLMVQKYLLCGHQAYVTIFAEAITQEERKKIPLSAEKCRQGGFWGGGKEVRV